MTVLAAFAFLSAPTRAVAQERSGFSFGVGGGFGSADATCDECGSGNRENGASGYLRVGYALNKHAILGAEVNLWMKKYLVPELEAEATVQMYNVSATLSYYPSVKSGFFLKGGAGGGFLSMDVTSGNTTVSTSLGSGVGFIVGAGYDIPLTRSRRVSVTPAVNYWYARTGDLTVQGETVATNWRQNVIDVTIGVTFH